MVLKISTMRFTTIGRLVFPSRGEIHLILQTRSLEPSSLARELRRREHMVATTALTVRVWAFLISLHALMCRDGVVKSRRVRMAIYRVVRTKTSGTQTYSVGLQARRLS